MDAEIRKMFESFQWSYSNENCQEMFGYTIEDYQNIVNQCRYFENTLELEQLENYQILYLLDYINTDPMIESFMNECIAPYVRNDTVGKDISDEFYRSIDIYNQHIANIEVNESVVLLTPIFTAASLIQNAYLFINDLINTGHQLKDYAKDNLSEWDIYEYLVKMILIPIKEFSLFHLDKEDVPIPITIVSSFGTLKADYMLNHADELFARIRENISQSIEEAKERQASGNDIVN